MLVALGVGAGLVIRGRGRPAGTERGPCYGNGTCNGGLTCLSRLCVVAPESATPVGAATNTAIVTGDKLATDVCACRDWACAQAALRSSHAGLNEAERLALDRELKGAELAKRIDECLFRLAPATGRTEATLQLQKLGKNLRRSFAENAHYPVGEVGLTPATPCCQGPNHRCPVSSEAWENPVWKSLDYANYDPSLFQYSYQSDGQTFTAKAVGDAGCRGEIVTYTMTGKAIHGNPVVEFTEPR
jgi:hypothetical protein